MRVLLVPRRHDDEHPETVRSCRHPRDATKRTVLFSAHQASPIISARPHVTTPSASNV